MRFLTILSMMTAVMGFSCITGFSDEIKTTENGLKYQFHSSNSQAGKPNPNDLLKVTMIYSINDSVLFDSRNLPNTLQLQLVEPSYQGDFFEGIAMMHLGDSASFWSPADSVMLRTFRAGTVPDFVGDGDDIRFDIKLLDFISPEEFERQRQEKDEALLAESAEKLKAYLKAQNITTNPTESGLYFIETKEGNGAHPQGGQRVSVHYTGTLLDGTKFDSSIDRGEPIVFTLGVGQVIRGWDEGISMMRPGGKARLIIPSHLAYGDRDMGVIPPHSPLVFDVELIEVMD